MKSLKLTAAFCERHFVVGELLRLVQFSLISTHSKVAIIRKKALDTFLKARVTFLKIFFFCSESDFLCLTRNKIMTKQNLDDRYASPKDQARICQLFSPFVGFITRNFNELNIDMTEYKSFERNPSLRSTAASVAPFDLDTVKTLLRCFLHVLNNLDPTLITDFWLQSSPKELETFFSILKMSVNIFKFVEKKKLGVAANLRVSISHGSENNTVTTR